MIILDPSVALKWFVADEPLRKQALGILDDVREQPDTYIVSELFMNEVLAVLCRLPGASAEQVSEALNLLERLGMTRVGNGHELLARAAAYALSWRLSGHDALYVALAGLTRGTWLTADSRAAGKVRDRRLVQLLGR